MQIVIVSLVMLKMFHPIEVNESPTHGENQSRNSLNNIIITLNSNKSDFYSSCYKSL